jgi:hypothetical protein
MVGIAPLLPPAALQQAIKFVPLAMFSTGPIFETPQEWLLGVIEGAPRTQPPV